MSNARIERMVRELNAEPSVQFFQQLFGLIGLGQSRKKAATTPSSRETAPTPA